MQDIKTKNIFPHQPVSRLMQLISIKKENQ